MISAPRRRPNRVPAGLYAIKVSNLGRILVKMDRDKPVRVDVKAYSDNPDELQKMLNNAPQWLRDKYPDPADQEKFLKTQAHMLIVLAYLFDRPDGPHGYHVTLDDRY